MGYEIYLSPRDEKQGTPLDSVVSALNGAGLSATVETDNFGHWVTFAGFDSALNLEVKEGLVKGGGMKFSETDDPALLEKIVATFHGLNWSVGDDEGELE